MHSRGLPAYGSSFKEIGRFYNDLLGNLSLLDTPSMDCPLEDIRTKTELSKIMFEAYGGFVRYATQYVETGEETSYEQLYLLKQQNFQLQQDVNRLTGRIQLLEQRLERLEEVMPEEKVIILREVSREQAEGEIRALFATGETLYYSDIAERLGLDLELVVEICNELKEQGDIEVNADSL